MGLSSELKGPRFKLDSSVTRVLALLQGTIAASKASSLSEQFERAANHINSYNCGRTCSDGMNYARVPGREVLITG